MFTHTHVAEMFELESKYYREYESIMENRIV